MWPYNSDEQVWLVPGKEWADQLPQPATPEAMPAPANDLNGAWPYLSDQDLANDNRPFDPQIIIRK